MPGPTVFHPPKIRPINPKDTALTTGLPLNPNGTYVANSYPTTAQNGAQGQYGAGLPQVQVTNQPTTVLPYDRWLSNVGSNISNFFSGNNTGRPAGVGGPIGPGPVHPWTMPNVVEPPPPATNYGYNVNQRGRGYKTDMVEGSTVTPDNYNTDWRGRGYDLFQHIQDHPEDFDKLPPAQQDAVKNYLNGGTGVSGGAGGGSDPLAGTPGHYYVDSTTEGSVGKVITLANGTHRRLLADRNGRLYYGKIGQNRRGRATNRARIRAQEQAAQNNQQSQASPFTGSFGVVNFNTATG